MLNKIKNWLAIFLTRYLMPRYEADVRSARLYSSAQEVCLRKDLKRYKERAQAAEAHVDMFKDVSDRLVKLALDTPDSEMSAFIHQTIMEVENARRYAT